MRLAVITTHPIQYYAPVFKLLAERKQVQVKVFYTLGNAANHIDSGFKQPIYWDIPLLDGYDYEFIENIAAKPGSDSFSGINNPGLIAKIDKFEPTALLIYGWAYQSHLRILRRYKGHLPIIFRGDSTLIDKQNPFKAALRHLFLSWVYKQIDYALYNGVNNKEYFENYGIKNERLIFAPHAVDNERFAQPKNAQAAQLRTNLGIGKQDVLILFAGKFEQKKDPLLLLRAFACIQKPQLHLLFVGDGELKERLLTESSTINNVHFLDFTNQADMPAVYHSCDVFCLPSKGPGETWGLAVNEAMACGKSIVVSDKVGCAADLVKNGINGYIFKSGDVNDLSQKLQHLIHSQNTLRRCGIHSAEIIKAWNFTEIAKAIEGLLQKLSFQILRCK